MSRIGRQPITVPADVTIDVRRGQPRLRERARRANSRAVPRDHHVLDREDGVITVERAQRRGQAAGAARAFADRSSNNMVTGRHGRLHQDARSPGCRLSRPDAGLEPAAGARLLASGHRRARRKASPSSSKARASSSRASTTSRSARSRPTSASSVRPEPYKGKGIRYLGERVRRKAGKAGKVGK